MSKVLFFCEHCNFKKIQSNTEGFYEYATSSIQRAVPYYDKEEKKTVESKFRKGTRKFRCPGCGRAITAKVMEK